MLVQIAKSSLSLPGIIPGAPYIGSPRAATWFAAVDMIAAGDCGRMGKYDEFADEEGKQLLGD